MATIIVRQAKPAIYGLVAPPSVEVLAEIISADFETGGITWKPRARQFFPDQRSCSIWNRRFAGKPALNSRHSQGYLYGPLFGRPRRAHLAIWALATGEWPTPPNQIDHINGSRADNRLANLRLVTRSENSRNMRLMRSNTSGYVGVRWEGRRKHWVAEAISEGVRVYIGSFGALEDAAAARAAFDAKHGFGPNHGRA